MTEVICKNCENCFKGKFCPECSQPAKVGKIDAHYFIHDIPHSIFHIDKGFFYTLKQLFTNPGKAMIDYLSGKRIRHFRPFGFVIILSTICTLLIKGINKVINLRYIADHSGEKIVSAQNFFVNYPSVLIFLMIPILSFVTWLCFKKRQYNYWEHFLVNTYLAAYLNIFFLLISVFRLGKYYLTNNLNVNYTSFMFIFMAYYGYAFGVFMAEKGKRKENIMIMLLMNFFLATIYMTSFSLSGLMIPWWGE
jgi:hypothetical protein